MMGLGEYISLYGPPDGSGLYAPAGAAPPSAAGYSTDLDPNQLADEASQYLQSYGGQTGIDQSSPSGTTVPPWVQPPPGYQPFLFPGVISLPAIDGNDHTILSFQVQPNWAGVIKLIANAWNGPGFIPGSGTLIWRITQNGAAMKNFDAIQVQFGIYSAQGGVQPLSLGEFGIPIYSGDTIALVINNVSQMGATTQVYGLLGGYTYPSIS